MTRVFAATVGLVFTLATLSAFAQGEAVAEDVVDLKPPTAGPRATPPTTATKKETKDKEEPAAEPVRTPSAPLPPQFLRLQLQDGTLLAGELSIKEISVETQFGTLKVPIEKIRQFTPGLESGGGDRLVALQKKISDLGSDDYKTREAAQKELSAQGARIRGELERRLNDDNAETKRRVAEILKEFDEQTEDADDEDGAPVAAGPLIRLDTVATSDFTVVGKISPTDFAINSKYGTLQLKLADIQRADRPVDSKESTRKNLSVNNIAQRSFKSSGIRVQAGDKISVKADGSMVMTPWGANSMCTPDGAANYGWYQGNEIPGGALVAKIGDKGTVFKVGKSLNIVAKSSGVLQFAVGVQADYAGENYQYPGEYKLKVKVDPK